MKKTLEKYKMVFLIVIMSIAGATGTFFKIALREIPIDLFTFMRFVFALLFFIPYLLRERSIVVNNKKNLILISCLGALNIFLFVWGIKYTTAIISVTLYAAVPLVVGLFSLVFLKENISFKKWLGIIVGFIGVLIIVVSPALGKSNVWNGTLYGNLIIVSALLIFCLYSIFSKKYAGGSSPIALTQYLIFTTMALQIIFLAFHLDDFKVLAHLSWETWASLFYCGVIGTTFYYFLYQYVIKNATPILASMVFFLQPLAGIMWARFLLGESVSSVFFVGGIFILFGMGLVFYEQYHKNKNG
jgi:drug/metabolite transporter (DMT)-like permease